jgi:DNA polymerase (family X)
VEPLVSTPEKLLELPGIGQGMVEHLTEIVKTGDYGLRKKLLKKYPATLLDLLNLQSLGPKKVAFLWKHFKAATVADVEKLAKEEKLRDLAGFGEKSEQNILKAVEVFKKVTGRFLISTVEDAATKIAEHIKKAGKTVESVTPAGSLRRGKETIGDLDLLVTMAEKSSGEKEKSDEGEGVTEGAASKKKSSKKVATEAKSRLKAGNASKRTRAGGPYNGRSRQEMIEEVAKHILTYPGIDQILAHGENKVSFTLSNGLQVDVRLLEKENFGAALLYFTGSKEHSVRLRGRANDMGWTLNEYDLATLKDEKRVAGRTEEEIYEKLKLEFVPPELRENAGEIEAAERHALPKLVELQDIKGDLQMHSTASDGKNTVEEMAEAAKALGHEYIAITDHSKAVTVANGLDEKRMAAHIKNLHAIDKRGLGIRILAGSEVDILKSGKLDYSDEILAQLDVVVCSIHSYFNLERAEMTERMLAAIENPYTQIVGHPTGRLLLKRDPLDYDVEKVLDACAKHGVALECNSYPDRLDLKDVYLRMCKEKGVKVVISTDSHNTGNLSFIRYGVMMARRGWLEKKDVINTRPAGEFLKELRGKKSKEARG